MRSRTIIGDPIRVARIGARAYSGRGQAPSRRRVDAVGRGRPCRQSRCVTKTRTFRAGLATGILAAAGIAGGLVSASATQASPLAGAAPASDQSSLRCHLQLPVSVRGHRFVSSPHGAAIACAGMLLARPVTEGALPQASGAVKPLHWAQGLPPAVGKTQLRLEAVRPGLPMDPPDHTAVKLTLVPAPASTNGAGHFTGTARIGGRDHHAAASIAFQPSTDTDCCTAGRLIIDMEVWNVSSGR